MSAAETRQKKFPNARPSTIRALKKQDEITDQLRRETEARKEQVPVLHAVQADRSPSPRRLKFSLIFMPWHWRRG